MRQKKDLQKQISDIQKEIHIYVQSNRKSTPDASELDEKLQEKIRLLRKTREIESKLLNIAELRQQKNPSQYIKVNSEEQLRKLNEDNKNISNQINNTKKEIEQKENENNTLYVFNNAGIIEEMAARSYQIETYQDKLIKSDFEKLFQNEENASDLADFLFDNPNCDTYIFCSIVHSLLDADDTTAIFAQKANEYPSKFNKIFPRLVHFYPSVFADQSSFLYRCGFEANQDIIQKAQNEIRTSLSGSITKFSVKNGNYQKLSSIYNDESALKSFIQPENIFMSSTYTEDEITDAFVFYSNLIFGLFKPEFVIRQNYKDVKPPFIKNNVDIEKISNFIISDLGNLISENRGNNDQKIISYLSRIKKVRENLKKMKNYFAASFLSLSKSIETKFKEAGVYNFNEKFGYLIHDFDMDIIPEREELISELKNGKIPEISDTQIDANQRLFYLVPYQSNDSLIKERKGLLIPIRCYYETALEYIGLTAPYQHPMGPESIDINLFRSIAVMMQYDKK